MYSNKSADNDPMVLDYRGYHIEFKTKDGLTVFTEFNGHRCEFGFANTNYKNDMKKIIDNFVDKIYQFSNGAYLSWFKNSYWEDIKLVFMGRTLKIFLTSNTRNEVTEAIKAKIIEDSQILLDKVSEIMLRNLEENWSL